MRRRKLFTLAAGASAVLCATVGVLWLRGTGRHFPARATTPPAVRVVGGQPTGEVSSRPPASRAIAPTSTQASEPPRAWPMGPPDAEIAEMRAASKRRTARAAELVGQIRNHDLIWWIARGDDGSFQGWFTPRVTTGPAEDISPRMPRGPAAELLNGYAFGVNRSDWPRYRTDEVRPALFQALDDPDRFAIAHYILAEVYRRGWEQDLEQRPDGTFQFTYDGLKVELRPDGAPEEGTTYEGVAAFQKCTSRIDPAQLPAIRERWLQEWR